MATKLTRSGAALYFSLEPRGKLAALFTAQFSQAIAKAADDATLNEFSKYYVKAFNERFAPEAIAKTLYQRTGELSSPGAVELYIARPGRRASPSLLRIKTQSKYATVHEEGREQVLGTPSIIEKGSHKFSIGGGKLYYVPLFSYFGRKAVDNKAPEFARGAYVIGKKVFKKKGVSYLLAYKKEGGEAFNKVRRAVENMRGAKGKRRLRSSSKTKKIWKAMFAIFVGPHTGIPGVSGSKYAKGKKSPARWFSLATGNTTQDTLMAMSEKTEASLPVILAKVLGLPVTSVGPTYFP